jgi:hypothetical protein
VKAGLLSNSRALAPGPWGRFLSCFLFFLRLVLLAFLTGNTLYPTGQTSPCDPETDSNRRGVGRSCQRKHPCRALSLLRPICRITAWWSLGTNRGAGWGQPVSPTGASFWRHALKARSATESGLPVLRARGPDSLLCRRHSAYVPLGPCPKVRPLQAGLAMSTKPPGRLTVARATMLVYGCASLLEYSADGAPRPGSAPRGVVVSGFQLALMQAGASGSLCRKDGRIACAAVDLLISGFSVRVRARPPNKSTT